MGKKKTHEQFIEEVFNLEENNYSVLGKYEGATIKILMKHNNCGYEWNIKPNNFLSGQRCPICSEKNRIIKKTRLHSDFIKMVDEIWNKKIIVLGNYTRGKDKIKFKCNICNCEWYTVPYNILRGYGCPQCAGVKKKSDEEFKQEIYNLVNNEYEFLEEYLDSRTKILIKHNICNFIYKVSPSVFLSGCRCPKCSGKLKYTTETFKEKVYELTGDEYILLSKYGKDNKDKVLIKHNKCNNEYLVSPNCFLDGCRCPICNESKGERKIRYYLENNKINLISQYTFENLKDIELLRFDFGILSNNNLICLIEYDGIGHYKEDVFSRYSYINTIKHDQMKNDYCNKNNIKLLRIPYWEYDNIEQILNNYFNYLNTEVLYEFNAKM
jgi:hypothetical protein